MKEKPIEKSNQITEGVIWKQLLLFFFPIVFGTFFQQIYNTADTVVVGRFVGKQALAAVGGSASQMVNLLVGFFVGLSSGAAVIISQFYGAKDEKNVRVTLHTAFAFSVAGGVILTIVGIGLSKPVLYWMNTPEDVIADSVTYLYIYFCGMIFNLIYNMGSGILRAVGDSKRPLYVLIVTCILNIILDVVFIVAFGMGVAGVAVATILSQAVSAGIVVWLLVKSTEMYRLVPREIKVQGKSLKSILRIGVPAGMESVMYGISNLVIQVFVNGLGTDTVAAWGTLAKIDAIFWMVINAFSIAITTFVGQNYGAGKFARMRKSVKVCLAMSFVSAAVISVALILASEPIYRLFTTDENVIKIGVHMIRFMLPAYSVFVIVGILSGALRGAGKVLVPMLLTCGGVCSLRLIWLFTVGRMVPGIDTIMCGYPVSWSITAVLFIIYYLKKFPRSREDI
ncbi:MAG: MATE family efflux transporter [Eubacteriales bacterium]|nr:MATE family efflux transporter [Eubacteriales bacterium]